MEIQTDLHDKNLFAYCDNNPVVRVDSGGDVWDIIDIAFAAWSWTDFIMNPSLGSMGWALLDTVALLPLIPSAGYITRTSKIVSKASKAKKTTKTTSKIAKSTKKVVKYKKFTENSNTIHHLFGKQRHGFSGLLKKYGGNEKRTYNAIYNATFNHVKYNKISGMFQAVVKIKGVSVAVRGNVLNGVVRLSTSYVV